MKAREIRVSGTVQGVGFRPFVFRLATRMDIRGHVRNTGSGVEIFAEAPRGNLDSFIKLISHEAPPLARINSVSSAETEPMGLAGFQILKSRDDAGLPTLPPPDIATCVKCLAELFDPSDRRYRYPFINCTDCGPRYTITRSVPYDRVTTTMGVFEMCGECRSEYEDPASRRFHAQPISCWDCGPSLTVLDSAGNVVQAAGRGGVRAVHASGPLEVVSGLLLEGKIIAIRGIGGFHLACNAEDESAVSRLRHRKMREGKPFAVMAKDLATAGSAVFIDGYEGALEGNERPIIILDKKPGPLPEEIAPGLTKLGIMLPYSPVHFLLFESGLDMLVMTSGNRGGEPIAASCEEAVRNLDGIADFFLVHNREIEAKTDDSVLAGSSARLVPVRMGRGYSPAPIILGGPFAPQPDEPGAPDFRFRVSLSPGGDRPVLGCGADLKNSVCLLRGGQAFMSPHIGDIENLETLQHYRNTISHFQRLLGTEPGIVACDMHPDYLSTRVAMNELPGEKIQVQHHHAHIASCMAENHLDGEVIGIALDGTGFGLDAAVWGGELLVAGFDSAARVGHIEEFRLPGGDAAVTQPWRVAVSLLHKTFGREFLDMNLPPVSWAGIENTGNIVKMIENSVNSPLTTSAGRLFDAVSSVIGIRQEVKFEAQAAMELEAACAEPARAYDYYLSETAGGIVLQVSGIIRGVVDDFLSGVKPGRIASRFHATVISSFSEMAEAVSNRTGIRNIALSGGVFQNIRILEGMKESLSGRNLNVYTHSLVPANDGGISLGQAAIARRQSEKG